MFKKKYFLLTLILIIIFQALLYSKNSQNTSFRFLKWSAQEVSIGKIMSISFFSGLFISALLNTRDITLKINYFEYTEEYDEPLKRAFTYKALNKLIQGSAADMTKKSMVALYENGIIPHIQIHDEVDISIESDKQAEDIIEIMESAVELKVPNKVDYESGSNWGDIK